MVAPKIISETSDLEIYSFEEYFEKFKEYITFAVRRIWVGQKSKSEHTRAKSIMKKDANLPWVFKKIVGSPRNGWRNEIPEKDRRTVYYINININKIVRKK